LVFATSRRSRWSAGATQAAGVGTAVMHGGDRPVTEQEKFLGVTRAVYFDNSQYMVTSVILGVVGLLGAVWFVRLTFEAFAFVEATFRFFVIAALGLRAAGIARLQADRRS
jgi:hypothetical protein